MLEFIIAAIVKTVITDAFTYHRSPETDQRGYDTYYVILVS